MKITRTPPIIMRGIHDDAKIVAEISRGGGGGGGGGPKAQVPIAAAIFCKTDRASGVGSVLYGRNTGVSGV